ncbi:MAG: hypothetical protein Q9190_007195 [Brigantiaea leucoxantha]
MGNTTESFDHFDYKLNTTICSDGKVCPKNDFSTSDNTTCCDNHQGKAEINFHNDAVMPQFSSDLSKYYARAGKTIPTDGVYVTASSTRTMIPATDLTTSFISRSKTTAPATSLMASSIASQGHPSLAVDSAIPTSSSSSSRPSTGAKAGIAVGVILGILVVAASVGFIFIRHRRRRSQSQEYQTECTSIPPQEPLNAMYSKGELSGESSKMEMDGAPSHPSLKTHEMAG